MALYHFQVSQIKRSAGKRVSESAAYRAGEKLCSDYYGTTFDYSRKSDVAHKEILLPPHAPREYADRATLWDAVEKAEHTKKAQLAYSFDIALQNEFSREENIALARRFVSEQFVARGMIADLCVHMPHKGGGEDNPHFHVLCPIRPLEQDGSWGAKQRREYLFDENGKPLLDDAGHQKFNAVPTTDWGRPETLEAWRAAWAEMCNRTFEEKRLKKKLDHRSYERQGIVLIPTVHEGPAVRKMEARGIRTEKGELNRWIRRINQRFETLKAQIKALIEALDKLKEEQEKFDTENVGVLLNGYYDKRNAAAYSARGRAVNFKAHVDTFNYLQARGINTLDDLKGAVDALNDRVSARQRSMRARDKRIGELSDLIRYAENYKRIKPIVDEMNAIHWKKKREKYALEHEDDLRLFRQSARRLKDYLQKKALPVKHWEKEITELRAANKAEYETLKEDRAEFFRLQKIEANLESALRREQPQRRHDHFER